MVTPFTEWHLTPLNKLDPLHHSPIRFATGAPFTTPHCDLYNLVDWTSLRTRRLHHWFLFIYKTILGITPLYLSSLLHLSHPARNLRSSAFINLSVTAGVYVCCLFVCMSCLVLFCGVFVSLLSFFSELPLASVTIIHPTCS